MNKLVILSLLLAVTFSLNLKTHQHPHHHPHHHPHPNEPHKAKPNTEVDQFIRQQVKIPENAKLLLSKEGNHGKKFIYTYLLPKQAGWTVTAIVNGQGQKQVEKTVITNLKVVRDQQEEKKEDTKEALAKLKQKIQGFVKARKEAGSSESNENQSAPSSESH